MWSSSSLCLCVCVCRAHNSAGIRLQQPLPGDVGRQTPTGDTQRARVPRHHHRPAAEGEEGQQHRDEGSNPTAD